MEAVFGWLTPDNNFIECEPYEHMDILRDNPEVLATSDIQDRFEELDAIEADCQALAENGEHPEWHHYEMAEYALSKDLYELLLKNGFIRVGENTTTNTLHFEATPETIKNRMQNCIDLASQFGKYYKFEPQRR